jgi:hypothetical protein
VRTCRSASASVLAIAGPSRLCAVGAASPASGSAAEVVTSGLLRLRTTTATAPAGRSAAPAGAASGRTTRRARREPPGGLDLHFHGLDAAQVAAIIARQQEGR